MNRRGIGAAIVVAVFCVVAIAPLVWHGLSSLKTASEVSRIPPTIVPESPTLSNYEELFVRRPFAVYFLNSLVIAFWPLCCVSLQGRWQPIGSSVFHRVCGRYWRVGCWSWFLSANCLFVSSL